VRVCVSTSRPSGSRRLRRHAHASCGCVDSLLCHAP
jgi:hypothetical protein